MIKKKNMQDIQVRFNTWKQNTDKILRRNQLTAKNPIEKVFIVEDGKHYFVSGGFQIFYRYFNEGNELEQARKRGSIEQYYELLQIEHRLKLLALTREDLIPPNDKEASSHGK